MLSVTGVSIQGELRAPDTNLLFTRLFIYKVLASIRIDIVNIKKRIE